MQAVILAGGKGKRLGRLAQGLPKPMVQVGGKPVLEHQIKLLAQAGIKDIWIVTGYKAEKISEYFGDGRKWGVKLHYSKEIEPLGTAGAVKSIAAKLNSDFLVMYGDVMVNFDVKRFINFHRRLGKKAIASIVVHPNDHPLESDLVEVKNNQVVNFFPKPHPEGIWYRNLVSAAVYILSPKIFSFIPSDRQTDFGKNIFPLAFKKKKNILAYLTGEYFRDMGKPRQLREVRGDYESGRYQHLTYQNKQQAIFLDRDGVINQEVDQLAKVSDLRVYDFAAGAIKKINQSKYLTIVVTNQPMVAKGFLTLTELNEIHKKLETELGILGAKIDAIYFCPHHPQRGFKGEVKALKINCQCRKPKIGLIKQAAADFNLNLTRSYLIGDSLRFDYQTAVNAGLKFVGVKTGYGCQDTANYGRIKPRHLLIRKNLEKAVDYIIKNKGK